MDFSFTFQRFCFPNRSAVDEFEFVILVVFSIGEKPPQTVLCDPVVYFFLLFIDSKCLSGMNKLLWIPERRHLKKQQLVKAQRPPMENADVHQ